MNTDLAEKLSRLQWLLHKQQMRGYAMGGPMADVTRGQGRILALLKMQDDISTKDLSYMLGIRISSLNELLSKLEKNGYITREPAPSDKRIMLIRLTDKGRQEEPQNVEMGGIFACLSDAEKPAFGDYLDRIIAALEAELGEKNDPDSDRPYPGMEEMLGRLRGMMPPFGGPEGPMGFPPHRRGHGFGGFPHGGRGGHHPHPVPEAEDNQDNDEE